MGARGGGGGGLTPPSAAIESLVPVLRRVRACCEITQSLLRTHSLHDVLVGAGRCGRSLGRKPEYLADMHGCPTHHVSVAAALRQDRTKQRLGRFVTTIGG
jgi:hypothetical protein